eukprot:gene50619-25686_t
MRATCGAPPLSLPLLPGRWVPLDAGAVVRLGQCPVPVTVLHAAPRDDDDELVLDAATWRNTLEQ